MHFVGMNICCTAALGHAATNIDEQLLARAITGNMTSEQRRKRASRQRHAVASDAATRKERVLRWWTTEKLLEVVGDSSNAARRQYLTNKITRAREHLLAGKMAVCTAGEQHMNSVCACGRGWMALGEVEQLQYMCEWMANIPACGNACPPRERKGLPGTSP